jgi:DNA-binding response OmpR family regulator
MSVLHGKHVLVVGDETSQVHNIEVALQREGAVIDSTTCEQISMEMLENKNIDVIFLNHLHDSEHCRRWLSAIQQKPHMRVLPIFALVQNNPVAIQAVLELGAADYFTSQETVKSILHKVKIVLGDAVNNAEDTVIDIGKSVVSTTGQGTRVLVVEDDPLLANLLSAQFERAKFTCLINRDGSNVLADIKTFQPDIIILDLMLPGCSGFDILKEIKTHEDYEKIPVFIFSNRDSASDKQQATELNASGFYVKAMTNLTDLVQKIETAIQPTE